VTFFGMMNVRNESRWIAEVIESLLPLCDFIFILDDNSTDDTLKICRGYEPRVMAYTARTRPSYQSLSREAMGLDGYETDKARDKNYIYDRLLSYIPASEINEESPYWVVAIDGDEVLEKEGAEVIRLAAATTKAHSLALHVRYLWSSNFDYRATAAWPSIACLAEEETYESFHGPPPPPQYKERVDGVYSSMWRPSVFHVINPTFKFDPTPFPGNRHCPNVPTELVGNHERIPVRLKHYGYLEREQRVKKYLGYLRDDPGNEGEDQYRHMVIGDLPSLPADSVTKLAGPLKLVPYEP